MGRFGCCCLFWGHALQAPNNGNKSSAKRERDGKLVTEGDRERETGIGQPCSVIVVVLFSLSSFHIRIVITDCCNRQQQLLPPHPPPLLSLPHCTAPNLILCTHTQRDKNTLINSSSRVASLCAYFPLCQHTKKCRYTLGEQQQQQLLPHAPHAHFACHIMCNARENSSLKNGKKETKKNTKNCLCCKYL